MNGIFVESNEVKGLLFNRYKNVPNAISSFMDKIRHNHDKDDYDVTRDWNSFKKETKGMMESPEPINASSTDKVRSRVKDVKEKTIKLIKPLGDLREIVADSKASFNSAIECIETVIIDLMNLCDQDMNILSLVKEVYYRKLFESDTCDMMEDPDTIDIMESSVDDMDVMQFVERFNKLYFTEAKSDKSDNTPYYLDKDLIDQPVDNEKYYPLFAMSVSYNFGSAYTFMGPIIHGVTNGDQYTHSFLSLDPDLKHITTFGGKGLEHMKVEDYEAFKYSKSVYVSVIFLSKSQMDNVRKTMKDYDDNPNDVRFSLINFFSMMMGKVKRKDKSHCCSAFLGYLLNVADKHELTKDYSQTRPEDIVLLPKAFFIGTFKNVDDLNKKRPEWKKKVKQIYDDNIDEIREYNNLIPRISLESKIKRSKTKKKFYNDLAGNMKSDNA